MAHDYLNPQHAPCEGCSPQHTSPEKEYGQPEHKGNGDTIGSLKKLAEVMQEEVSQEQETVDDKLSKPDNSYIDQVVEEFRERFHPWYFVHASDRDPIETFLREKLVQAGKKGKDEAYYNMGMPATVKEAENLGKSAERQRIRGIVEDMIAEYPFDRREWDKPQALADLLARLDV